MSKQDIEKKLKENYKNRLINHIKHMEKQGYILAKDKINSDSYLMQFNLTNFNFIIISKLSDGFKEVMFNDVENPFNIYLGYAERLDFILNNFTTVDVSELNTFLQYEKNMIHIIPEKEMQEDLKSILNLTKKLAKPKKELLDTKVGQAVTLAKENVFYTGRDTYLSISECNKYYQWKNKQKKFKKIDSADIVQILQENTGIKYKELEINKNMRTIYPQMLVNSIFPVKWNKQQELQEKLKKGKKAHDKIAKIVANYE